MDGTFITNRKKTFFQGLALLVGGFVGAGVTALLTGGVVVGLFGFASAWGIYLMLRAAKAGRNIAEVEGQACVTCTQLIPSVMVGKFCERCGKPVHRTCMCPH